MLKKYRGPLQYIFKLADILIILLSFSVTYFFTQHYVGFLNTLSMAFTGYAPFLIIYILIWIILSNKWKLYDSKRMSTLLSELFDLIKTTTISLTIPSLAIALIVPDLLAKNLLVFFWLVQTFLLISFRLFIRETLRVIRRRGYNFRVLLIVGSNGRTKKLVEKIQINPEYGLQILGFLDDLDKNRKDYVEENFKIIGNLSSLKTILTKNVVDEVFITLPIKSYYEKIQEIIGICEEAGIEVKLTSDFFNVNIAKDTISVYNGIPVIDFYSGPDSNWKLVVKRLMDIAISIALLVPLAPLFILVAIIIKITSKGSVFFKQQRLGYNGRQFTLLKFRSMVEDAENIRGKLNDLNEMSGPVFKIKNDPRVTNIGKFLRKTSIDELPQLINVLKGDMSLVGPRPPILSEVDQYDWEDRRRLSIRPGITCIWQVSGRNTIPFEKWMELDRQYIDQWSLWLDLKILAKTLPAVLRGSGL